MSKHPSKHPTDKLSALSQSKEWISIEDSIVCKQFHTIPPSTGPTTVETIKLPKLACFDMDSTLIRTRSGRVFPLPSYQGAPDYDWLHPTLVPDKLRQLHKDGWEIVIFTNQLDSIRRNLIGPLQDKLDHMIDRLGIPISVYMSMQRDINRKPNRGMFETCIEHYHTLLHTAHPDLSHYRKRAYKGPIEAILYVGDAAGRATDHSADDLNFARNIFSADSTSISSRFFLPETFFYGDLKMHCDFFGIEEAAIGGIEHAKVWSTPSPPQSATPSDAVLPTLEQIDVENDAAQPTLSATEPQTSTESNLEPVVVSAETPDTEVTQEAPTETPSESDSESCQSPLCTPDPQPSQPSFTLFCERFHNEFEAYQGHFIPIIDPNKRKANPQSGGKNGAKNDRSNAGKGSGKKKGGIW